MLRVSTKKKKRIRRLYGLAFLIFLSAGAGVGLFKLSPSLLDISRSFRHAADKILEETADTASAEPVLRGTIFDRHLKELAVSYRLFSLYVRPSEITDQDGVIRILSDVTGQDAAQLQIRLNQAKSMISIARNLEQGQVDMIRNARLQGLYIRPVEERFYPEHETGGSLVGFTAEGMGLTGIEGEFDELLREGHFRADAVPEIDFDNQQVLGRSRVDLVLTIDLDLQKEIERQLGRFLDKTGATRGTALCMNPQTGAILAWGSLPSYNPNYYWNIHRQGQQNMHSGYIEPDLLHNLQVRLAALRKQGISGDFLLPETVARKDYGLTETDVQEFGGIIPVETGAESNGNAYAEKERPGIQPVELAAAVAGLINGGWKITPYVLDALYDAGQVRIYPRADLDTERQRVLTPAMGIKVRHELNELQAGKKTDMILLEDSLEKMALQENGKSEHLHQDLLVAALPAKAPELMLLMVSSREALFPLPGEGRVEGSLQELGQQMLADISRKAIDGMDDRQLLAEMFPQQPDQTNYRQFLISSKIDFRESTVDSTGNRGVMPQLVGLSLRKGLQRLNEHDLQVKVQGSGQIVSQFPAPGQSLQGIGECVLTLASEI